MSNQKDFEQACQAFREKTQDLNHLQQLIAFCENFANAYSTPEVAERFDPKYDLTVQHWDPEKPKPKNPPTWKLYRKDGSINRYRLPKLEHIQRVGIGPWNRETNQLERLIADIDVGHGNNRVSQREADAIAESLKGVMNVNRSGSGLGYHAWKDLAERTPCESQTDLQAICPEGLRAIEQGAGIKFPKLDNPPFLWIAARDRNPDSFKVESNSALPLEWKYAPPPPVEAKTLFEGSTNVDALEVALLLRAIDPTSYQLWIQVGQCLHRIESENPGFPGFALYESWSRRSSNFEEGKCEEKWRTFGNPASRKLAGLTRLRELAGVKKERFGFTPLNDFLDTEFNQVELIEGFLVEDQYTFFAGAEKTLKTTLGLEAAIALATGTPFLGEFLTLKRRVVMMSRESGGYTLRETVKRQLASRGLDRLEDDSFILSEDLPRFESDSDLATLERYLADMGTEVFLLDPTYLAMTASDQRTREKDGQQFDRIGQVCRAVGATCILIEHANKGSVDRKTPRPMRIPDLPFGGGPAWARQFWLMARVKEYQDGSGLHELWFRVAGSTGLSSLHRLTIDEGTDWKNRKWEVSIRPEGEVQRETKELEERCKQDALEEQVLKVLSDEPMLLSKIKESVKCKRESLEAMVGEGLIQSCPMDVNGRTRTGYRRKA